MIVFTDNDLQRQLDRYRQNDDLTPLFMHGAMMINANKPDLWKADIAQSVDYYNDWFLRFAPQAFRETRIETTERVLATFRQTRNLADINPDILRANPAAVETLRMTTAPPLARDRLVGLAGISTNLVKSAELRQRVPYKMSEQQLRSEFERMSDVFRKLADVDILPWLSSGNEPTEAEIYRAASIVADRLCGAVANPIIRNAQERRQLSAIKNWLDDRGYRVFDSGQQLSLDAFPPGRYGFRLNAAVEHGTRHVNVPIDAVVMPHHGLQGELPVLIEAKSAGDFTNTNKRRKEEATKNAQLRLTYGDTVRYILFLCGYFDSGYLGYEAAEGIDWVWEHRIDDLSQLGL